MKISAFQNFSQLKYFYTLLYKKMMPGASKGALLFAI